MLLWWREQSSPRVSLLILNLDQLRIIDDIDQWLPKTPGATKPCFATAPEFSIEFEFGCAIAPGKHAFTLPAAFSSVPEFFVITNNPALPDTPGTDNCCVYAIDPSASTIDVLPQDWFNHGGLDYGYQWITSIARDPATRRLVGGGFRINNFALDETGRNLSKHWF
jgi:hypothetical protein